MPQNTWRDRLYTPTLVTKLGNDYFLVDCWHNRILYSQTLDHPLSEWQTLAEDIRGGHTISSDGSLYLVDDTEHGSLRTFMKKEGGFQELQRIVAKGTRPHFTAYCPEKQCFLALLSSGNHLLRLQKQANGHLAITEDFQVPGAENEYIRSFTFIDGYIYLVSGGGFIRKVVYRQNFRLVENIPIPPEFAGMNGLTKLGNFFYLTTYTRDGKIAPRFVRTRDLRGISRGDYEDLYKTFGFKGVPYFISSFDGRHYVTEIDTASGFTSFALQGDKIVDIKAHCRYSGALPASLYRKAGGGAVLYADAYDGPDVAEKKQDATVFIIGKARLDLSCYTGKDTYSDGAIEDELLLAARKGKLQELMEADNRWPVLYHATPDRENLLGWLPIDKNARVLEIGSGCGALTGLLCRKAAQVETVEISPRRAEIAAYRWHEAENLTIHVGNLAEIPFEKKFDLITLIGVLEYAPSFTHTARPCEDFLASIKRLLAPGGKLVIAIENRLGLKYWSGAPEDHTSRRFDGITGYQGVSHVRTFSKKELTEMLTSCGLAGLSWYYPYPDYKLPLCLHSPRLLPTAADFANNPNLSYDQSRWELFPEKEVFAQLLPAGLYEEMANSFLVICSETEIDESKLPLAIHCSFRRKRDYHLYTEIWEENGQKAVRKIASTPAQKKHLQAIAANCRLLSAAYGAEHVAQARLLSEELLEMEYIEGRTLADYMRESLKTGDREKFLHYLDFYKENILRGEEGTTALQEPLDPHAEDRAYDIDVNFENVIFVGDKFMVYDYEWMFPKVSKKYVLWRNLAVFRERNMPLIKKATLDFSSFWQMTGFSLEDINLYASEERRFQLAVSDIYANNYVKTRYQIH